MCDNGGLQCDLCTADLATKKCRRVTVKNCDSAVLDVRDHLEAENCAPLPHTMVPSLMLYVAQVQVIGQRTCSP